MKAAVLTISDGVARGERDDESGAVLEQLLTADGYEVVRRVVPDDRSDIAEAIEELTEEARVVLTTGGTGVAPRDVTPRRRHPCSSARCPGSRRRFGRTPRAGRPMACCHAGSRGSEAARSSSTCPARPAGVATDSQCSASRCRTPSAC